MRASRLSRIVPLVLMTVVSAPALAASLRPAAACPALFGTARERSQAARGKQRLYWVHEETEGITVAHSSDQWTEPVELELQGVRLLGGGREQASVRISPALGKSLGCAAGDYGVARHDRIGAGARVLAVLQSGVLLERSGALVFLRAPTTREARWLMAWSAPGTVKLPEGGGGEPPVGLYETRSRYRGEIY
jgi:hypothetical protein